MAATTTTAGPATAGVTGDGQGHPLYKVLTDGASMHGGRGARMTAPAVDTCAPADTADPCPVGDPACETGDDGSCHDGCAAPRPVATDAGTLRERADAQALVNAWIAEATDAGEVEDGVLPDWLAELVAHAEHDFRTKVERAGLAARRLAFDARAIEAEIGVLTAKLATKRRNVDRLKDYARMCLEIAGEERVETPLVTVRLQTNGGAAPVRWTRPLVELPEAFRRLPAEPWTLNASAAQTYYRTHGTLPSGFEVLPRGRSLRIA